LLPRNSHVAEIDIKIMRLLIKKTLKQLGLWKIAQKARQIGYRFNKQEVASDGSVALPKTTTIELTIKCNLNCKMCTQQQDRKIVKKDYTFNDFCKILDNLGSSVNYLSFIGGEIFVHPDIFEILGECQRRKIKVHLSTNATLLDEQRINRLKKLKNTVRGIGVSIDGLPKTHNLIRGSKDAFERTVQALKMLVRDFSVSINTVIFKENLDELLEVIDIFRKQGVQNFSWQFEIFSTPQEILASSKILDIPLKNISTEEKIATQYDFSHQKIKELIEKVRAIKNISFMVQPRVYDRHPDSYFNGSLRQDVKVGCKDIFTCRIDAQGNVIFCPIIKTKMGNLLEKPIDQIWNSERFKKMRSNLLKSNLTPVCKRCCRLG